MNTFYALSAILSKISIVLVAIAATGAVYQVQPQPSVIDQVSAQATYLSETYGSRPPYSGSTFTSHELLSPDEATIAAPYILACESRNKQVGCIPDANGKDSCGPAQFQDWKSWEAISGIYGNPNNESTSIEMLMWGLENGYIQRWSCAKIEGLLERFPFSPK